MQVDKTIDMPDGSVQFQGTLTQSESDLVIKVGLSYLMQAGVIKLNLLPPDNDESVIVQ